MAYYEDSLDAAVKAAQDAARAARGSQSAAEASAGGGTPPVDSAVAAVVGTPASATRTALDARYATTASVTSTTVAKGALLTNAKDYGATGDGTTDDRIAIQSAITATAAGGTVLLPPGVYVMDAAWVITKAITIQGQSATVLKGATTTIAGNWITANVGGISFSGLSFSDSGSKVTGAVFSSGAAISGISFDRCTFNTPAGLAIRLARVTNGRVTDCQITACRVGVQVENDASAILVRRVDISGWKDRGVYVVGGSAGSPQDVRIDAVSVTGFVGGGTARYPIMTVKGVATARIGRLYITNCSVEGPSKSFTAATDPGTADQIAVFDGEDFRIIGCQSRWGGDMGITVDGSSRRGIVANNLCASNDASGIAVWTGATNVTVSNNTCLNNGQNRNGDRTSYGKAGIRIVAASNVIVSGNVLGDDQGTKTQNHGVSMTSCTNVSLGPDIDGGNATGLYYKDGAANTLITIVSEAAF